MVAQRLARGCSPWRYSGPVRRGPHASWLPFWNLVFRAYRACPPPRSPVSRFTDWQPRSRMNNWSRRRSRSPVRSFGASSDRRTCWRVTPRTWTRISQPPHPGNWRAAATPRANEGTCGWSDWRLWSVRRDMCPCGTVPTPATGRTRPCRVNAGMPWGNDTMLGTTGIRAPVPGAAPWCATAVRGGNHWNWIGMPPVTIP